LWHKYLIVLAQNGCKFSNTFKTVDTDKSKFLFVGGIPIVRRLHKNKQKYFSESLLLSHVTHKKGYIQRYCTKNVCTMFTAKVSVVYRYIK